MQDPSEKSNLQEEQPNTPQMTEQGTGGRFQAIRPVLMIVGIISVVMSFVLRMGNTFVPGFFSWLLMVGGLILFLITWLPPEKVPFIKALEKILDSIERKINLSPVKLILLISTPFLLAITHFAAGDEQLMRSPWMAVTAWLLSIVLAVLAGWKREKIVWNKHDLIFTAAWTVGFIALGIGLRSFNLTHIPVNLTGDEASAGLYGVEFIDGLWNNIFRTGWYEFPSLYFIIPASSISLFGQTIAGLRLPSAIAGGLAVGLLYLLGRVFYNHRTGVIAAALLAASHFHIHFSRIGLNNIWDGIFYIAILGLLWRAWQKENRNLFLLAGVVFGLSQYFYASARMLLGLVPMWLVVLAVSDRKKFKRQLGNLGFMVWVALLVYGPLLIYTFGRLDQYMAPMSRVSFSPDTARAISASGSTSLFQVYSQQLAKGLGAYNLVNAQHWYTPGVPILLYVESGFFMLGVLLLFTQWRSPKSWFIASWLVAFGLMGALSESAPASQRYSASVPAAMLLAAFAIDEVFNRLALMWQKVHRWVFDGVIWLIVLAAMVLNLNFYFNMYTPESYNRDYNTLLAQKLADWLMANPEQWQVMFFGNHNMGYYAIPSIKYLATNAVGYDVNDPWGSADNPKVEPGNVLFVFMDTREDDRLAVEAQYPGCEEIQEGTEEFGVMYKAWVCYDLKP